MIPKTATTYRKTGEPGVMDVTVVIPISASLCQAVDAIGKALRADQEQYAREMEYTYLGQQTTQRSTSWTYRRRKQL